MFIHIQPHYSMFEITIENILYLLLFSFVVGFFILLYFFTTIEYCFSKVEKVAASFITAEQQTRKVPSLSNIFAGFNSDALAIAMPTEYIDITVYYLTALSEDRKIVFKGDVSEELFYKAKNHKLTILFKRGYLSGSERVIGVE